jgi:hypothetical protein
VVLERMLFELQQDPRAYWCCLNQFSPQTRWDRDVHSLRQTFFLIYGHCELWNFLDQQQVQMFSFVFWQLNHHTL